MLRLKWEICQLPLKSVVPLRDHLILWELALYFLHKDESNTALYIINRKNKKDNSSQAYIIF